MAMNVIHVYNDLIFQNHLHIIENLELASSEPQVLFDCQSCDKMTPLCVLIIFFAIQQY